MTNAAAAPRIALLYPGDRAARDRADPAESRFAALFEAFAGAGMAAEPAVYHDDFADEVAAQLRRMAPYFDPAQGGGHMVDQAWQPRLAEGMVRAYLVGDRVTGFGHQAVNALCPARAGEPAPQPGPRLYHGPDLAAFQGLKRSLESQWVGLLCRRVGLAPERLPLLWDCDFLLGERAADEAERYVLCEINVSSVSPFPSSSIAPLVAATLARLGLAAARAG